MTIQEIDKIRNSGALNSLKREFETEVKAMNIIMDNIEIERTDNLKLTTSVSNSLKKLTELNNAIYTTATAK